ncbi:PS-10 peptidase S37 [Streptomyces puniciscabiei]|uniref:PS-10 peptidase S37 n=1 Tax=Streptomyces puniciscabiei TaxID=164348 RepID=A0A542TH13_9ACTN|nr:S28 family serine protease [Streptomyces puniciscabiei]TQK86134.1 PS-10 peptidase S37 [Streptomyces puniciscabiei]
MRTRTRRRVLLAATATGLSAAAALPAHAAVPHAAEDDDIVRALSALPGLRVVEERPGAEPGYRFFVLGLRQPVDHTDPAAGTFEQRLTLLHTGLDRPMILATTGYEAPLTPHRTEPAELLGGNQLLVEHRCFGTSRPAQPDYTHLTIRQAADDHHRVVRLLRRLYRAAWISTGGSKGGMASVYHRRFYPHDVDGTIAYSAPDNVDDRDDSAYLRFLDSVGSAADREALRAVQRRLLQRRPQMVARYEAWAAGIGDGFGIVGSADKALEIAVLRAPLMFWQNGGSAAERAAIPGPDSSDDALYTWLDATAGLALYADRVALHYVPYWYQIGTQLGYLGVPTAHLAGLLRYPDSIEARTFVPRDIPMRFDSGAMPDVDRWVRRCGSRLLFVNGTQDPAVAEPFPPGARDSRVLWAPGANHHVSIADLSSADRARAVGMITRWAARR